MENALIVFQGKNIRRTWHNDEWWFSIFDIISALTDSSDPKQYIKKMRQRDPFLSANWGTLCTPLELTAFDGKKREITCVNTKNAFRIIQSIPSPKAEPFKQWLSQLGHERIQEIENPELAQNRVKEYYELKGYPKEWIDKRLRGIAIRQELTEEWKTRDVTQEKEFGILTNEITKATFGKSVQEYKEFKGLPTKNQNLRDHMTDWELILTMVGEKATTDITKETDAQGLEECKVSAKEGGEVANDARTSIETRLGRSVITDKNFLPPKEKSRSLK